MAQRSARIPRVFVEAFTTPLSALSKDELHHLRRVLRLDEGDQVRAFDSAGNEANGRLAGNAIEHSPPIHRPHDIDLYVASAVPKGDRALWMVEKLAEIGVVGWQPLLTEHGSVDPRSNKLDKLRRRAIEAAKQSNTPGVMHIEEPRSLQFLLENGCDAYHVLSTVEASPPVPARGVANTLLVGPEGGWSAGELELMRQCEVPAVTLGPTVLRIETAAIVGAGVFAALLRR